MEFSVKSGKVEKQRTGCVVVGIFEKRKFSEHAASVNAHSDNYLTRVTRSGDMDGRLGQTCLLPRVPNMLSDRVLLVGCGQARKFDEAAFRKVIISTLSALRDTGANDASIYLTDLEVRSRDYAWKIREAALVVQDTLYRFDRLKTVTAPSEDREKLKRLSFNVASRTDLDMGEAALTNGLAAAAGIKLCRDLANLPGNICTPTYLADQAIGLSQQYASIDTQILEQADMEELGMGALLSVSKGSRQPPKLIVMQHKGAAANQQPIVLVGKGLTFDAGGISIKPAAAMDEMKYDMCGGATVFGVIRAIAELNLPLNVIGVVPASENMPDGAANKPGDVVTSMSGQTIEVLNTDAEGRLILCDALTYSKRFNPDVVIDIATLTGACIIALGKHASGLFSNDDHLRKDLVAAGENSHDRVWPLPMWPEYDRQLRSNFADMANIGGREAGSVTAACFLARYTRDMRWAHLDIAGTAWVSGARKGATGRPVQLLLEYLDSRLRQPHDEFPETIVE